VIAVPITVASSTEQQPWPPIVSSKNPYGTKKKYRYGTTKKDRRKEVAISLSEFKHTKEGMDFHYDTLIANRDPPLIPPVVHCTARSGGESDITNSRAASTP